MWSTVVAERLGIIGHAEAVDAPRQTLDTLETHGAPRAERPVLQLVRPPTRREADGLAADRRRRSTPDPVVRRQRLARRPGCRSSPTPSRRSPDRRRALYDSMDFGFYYRPERQPDRVPRTRPSTGESPCCYDTIVSESRIATLHRHRQGRAAREGVLRRVADLPRHLRLELAGDEAARRPRAPTSASTSSRAPTRTRTSGSCPGWGGSMFEALMPALFVPEEQWAPAQLGGQPPADRRGADPPRPGRGASTATGASRPRTSPRAATASTASTRSA